MPCRDWEDVRLEEAERRRHKMARLLCWLCRRVDSGLIESNKELKDWWDDHQKLDKFRESREEKERKRQLAKRRALQKLTDEEKKALGIK